MGIYTIPEENIEKLEKKILKLQNRANKNNLEPIVFEKLASFGICIPNIDGVSIQETYYNVFVEGKPPMMPGFKLIGKLEPSDTGNILSLYDKDFKDFHKKFGEKDATCCDHCNTNRKRNYGYVVQNTEENKELIVASSCLENYVIEKDPEQIAAFESLEKYIQEEHGKRTTIPELFFDKKDMLAFIVAKVKTSNYNHYSPTTIAKIMDYGKKNNYNTDSEEFINNIDQYERHSLIRLKNEIYTTHTELYKQVEDIVTFAKKEYDEKAKNDQEDYKDWNKYLVVHNNNLIKPNQIGYFYSVIKDYNTSQQLKKNEHLNYVGEVGKMGEFDVKLSSLSKHSSLYGSGDYFKYEFRLQNNDKITLFTTKTLFEENNTPEDFVRITGKIKDHKMYNNEKSTIIKNVKVLGKTQDFTTDPVAVLEEVKKTKKTIKKNVL